MIGKEGPSVTHLPAVGSRPAGFCCAFRRLRGGAGGFGAGVAGLAGTGVLAGVAGLWMPAPAGPFARLRSVGHCVLGRALGTCLCPGTAAGDAQQLAAVGAVITNRHRVTRSFAEGLFELVLHAEGELDPLDRGGRLGHFLNQAARNLPVCLDHDERMPLAKPRLDERPHILERALAIVQEDLGGRLRFDDANGGRCSWD